MEGNSQGAAQKPKEGRRAQGWATTGEPVMTQDHMAARTEVTNAKADVEAGGIVSLVVHVKLKLVCNSRANRRFH
jgi:hypothetical protein